jgi:hypothetical protein
MDYQQEQDTELEALGYIYPDEIEIDGKTTSIRVDVDDDRVHFALQSQELQSFKLVFTLPDTYPDIPPILDIVDPVGIEHIVGLLIQDCNSRALESLGMAMMYELVAFSKERAAELICEYVEKEEQEVHRLTQRERLELQLQEEELARNRGTPVTKQSFEKWREDFLVESIQASISGTLTQAMETAIAVSLLGKPKPGGKLTGRQLFDKDLSLVQSDMQFEDGDVQVDFSLFEGIELEDEDPAYNVLDGFDDED